jgi:hypothetical protein
MKWLAMCLFWGILCLGNLQNCVAQNCCIDPQVLTREAYPISSSDLSLRIVNIIGKAYADFPEPLASIKLKFDIDKTGCITAVEVCEPPNILPKCGAEIREALIHQWLFQPAELNQQSINSQLIYPIRCIRWER